MKEKYIAENHVVDRYVQGKLADAERDEFELYMLDHPEILDDVEYAMAMNAALQQHDAALQNADQTDVRSAGRPRFHPAVIFPLAAALMIAAVLPLWFLERGQPTVLQLASGTIPESEFILVEQMRSGGQLPIEVSSTGPVPLLIDVGPDEFEVYEISVTDTVTGESWALNTDTVSADRYLRVIYSGSSGAPQQLEITGRLADANNNIPLLKRLLQRSRDGR